jgi:chemotaxis protein methyltransferase CheR
LRARPAGQPIRIWSSASSSGEEVYSIAMCLLGKDRREAQWTRSANIRLLATDLSSEMVEATRKAVYDTSSAEAIPQPYRKLWTHAQGDKIAMDEAARALVSAMQLNLFERWPMQRQFDAIFCRNVMIYFDETAKAELESRLFAQLVPGGILYIGHSERLVGPQRDIMIPCGQTIYRKPATGENIR